MPGEAIMGFVKVNNTPSSHTKGSTTILIGLEQGALPKIVVTGVAMCDVVKRHEPYALGKATA